MCDVVPVLNRCNCVCRDQTVIEHKERMKRRNEKDKLREAAGLD